MTSPRAPHFIIISIHSALCTHAEVKSYWRMTVKLLFCRGSQSSDDIINGRSVCKRKEGGVAFLGDAGMLGPPLPSSQMGWPLGSPQTLRFHKGNQCPSPECFCLINPSSSQIFVTRVDSAQVLASPSHHICVSLLVLVNFCFQ